MDSQYTCKSEQTLNLETDKPKKKKNACMHTYESMHARTQSSPLPPAMHIHTNMYTGMHVLISKHMKGKRGAIFQYPDSHTYIQATKAQAHTQSYITTSPPSPLPFGAHTIDTQAPHTCMHKWKGRERCIF